MKFPVVNNGDCDYTSAEFLYEYDKLAIKLVARTMGISMEEVVYLLEH